MKIKNSMGFRLFLIFSSLLITFVCLLTYIQVFIIGRMYTTSIYVQEREKELSANINDFFIRGTNITNKKEPGKGTVSYDMEEIQNFERKYNVNLLIFNNNSMASTISIKTKKALKPSYINFIRSELREHRYEYSLIPSRSFRVYGSFHIPTKYIAAVYPFVYGAKNIDYIVAIIPEVFTSSASNILRTYVSYALLISLMITLALSGFFSYIVSKPILQINKTASRMAKMDFSAKCKIERNDEIGSLAGTLNYLSYSLESTLQKLYDANTKLQGDLNFQRELDMLRKDFIAAITHEFKTPLTLIRGYSESIKDNVANGEDREFAVDTIINETEKIDKLVNDLLELSKLESVGYKLNISSFDIDKLLSSISEKYEKIMKDRNIKFTTITCKSTIMVNGNPFRVEQVITNFLNNAINNTAAEREVVLSLEDNGDTVIVSVRNQGKQIEEDEIKRIWEKFYRIEKSRNKKYGGSGLGLAISSAILKLHNSRFGAENTPDGVKFYFTLEKAKL